MGRTRGLLAGIWFSGTEAALAGRREWAVLIVLGLTLAGLAAGVGGCLAAMAVCG